jgi:tRNA (cytosine34-C5)-methyltransferase
MNPIENEAVVSGVLQHYNGTSQNNDGRSSESPTLELLEWTAPEGLTLRPGVCHWKVADHVRDKTAEDVDDDETDSTGLRWHRSYEEAVNKSMEQPSSTMWPPQEELSLHRCIRLWPQDQDSGGFFIALIRKNREV